MAKKTSAATATPDLEGLAANRVAIEAVQPTVDGGLFAAKVVDGQDVTVSADIFCDGHDIIDAAALTRSPDGEWTEWPMHHADNDRWAGTVRFEGNAAHELAVRAWRDPFAWFAYEVRKKHDAGVPVALEIEEGIALVEEGALSDRLEKGDLAKLKALAKGLKTGLKGDPTKAVALANDPDTAALMRRAVARRQVSQSGAFPIWADRPLAAHSAWYELFPRSASGTEDRHGTFADVETKLPYVKDLGFDVLYFPPIHPIGTTNRKGRNNTLTPGPDDVGVPYAIGSADGGHMATHPELGTLADFDRLVKAAAKLDIEIALDIAIQASPDHPWITEHPEWFEWRPDGSIRFAENPPKKYEDIVNFHFHDDALPGVWHAFLDVFLFWAARGVTVFRVDNPHTKPFPFWQWCIARVREEYPGSIFLAEAFTRPKVMARLGKVGFNQSYTYFTWRNARWELEEYISQLTGKAPGYEEMPHIFRPNFFTQTPDINPPYLQTGGRAAHRVRLILAATLAGNYGIYNGFEICEATPVPGREEYLDSEKYQLRAFDLHRPGHIKDDIRFANRIRREHAALQTFPGHSILSSDNDQVMVYARHTADLSSFLLFAVNLDPHNAHGVTFEVPLWRFGLGDHEAIDGTDLVTGDTFQFHGKWQNARLDPEERPYCVWQLHAPK